MSSLTIGIIGMGVGEAHINGYLAHPACKIKTLCDFSAERQEKIREKYPQYSVTDNAQEVLEDPEIDAVSIASFDQYHTDQIIMGLRQGKHLFVEKPLCHTQKEAEQIAVEMKKRPTLKISSNLILRRSPRFIGLKKMIENGELGVISNIKGAYNYGRLHKITEGWRGRMAYYSGVCGGGIHIIDLMQWLIDSKIVRVSAIGNKMHSGQSSFKQNDLVNGILNFENGTIGVFSSDMGCVHPHFHSLDVYGTCGTFINQKGNALLYSSRNDIKPKYLKTNYPGVPKGGLLYDFVESILNGSSPEIVAHEIFHSLAVCFAIDKSVATGLPQSTDTLL